MDSPKEKLRDSAMAENKKNILDCISLVGTSPCIFEGEKTYISTGAVNHDYIDLSLAEKVTYQNRPSRANLSVKNGDILFAKMCGTQKTVRIDKKNAEYLFSTGFYAVRAKETVITSPLLYYLLDSEQFLKQKDQNCSGATQKAITNEGLKKIKISLPPLAEQRKIAAVLDKVSDLIAKRRTQLDKLDELVQARFVELFGDPVGNPMGWEKIALGKRCDIVTGNTPSRADPENYGNFIEWIKSDNINTSAVLLTEAQEYLSETGFHKCRFVEAGSLLMTCIAGSINCIGNVAVTDRRVAFNQQINAIVPKQDDVLYLYWLMLLSKPAIHSTINMALKGILSKGQLSEMVFPFPPLELQNQFSVFVKETEKTKTAISHSLQKLEILKKALMQEYFG